MSTTPNNPERSVAGPSEDAVRGLAERLFERAEAPPYAGVIDRIPQVVSELSGLIAPAQGDNQSPLLRALASFTSFASEARSAGALSDDQLLALAEQLDQLATLCGSADGAASPAAPLASFPAAEIAPANGPTSTSPTSGTSPCPAAPDAGAASPEAAGVDDTASQTHTAPYKVTYESQNAAVEAPFCESPGGSATAPAVAVDAPLFAPSGPISAQPEALTPGAPATPGQPSEPPQPDDSQASSSAVAAPVALAATPERGSWLESTTLAEPDWATAAAVGLSDASCAPPGPAPAAQSPAAPAGHPGASISLSPDLASHQVDAAPHAIQFQFNLPALTDAAPQGAEPPQTPLDAPSVAPTPTPTPTPAPAPAAEIAPPPEIASPEVSLTTPEAQPASAAPAPSPVAGAAEHTPEAEAPTPEAPSPEPLQRATAEEPSAAAPLAPVPVELSIESPIESTVEPTSTPPAEAIGEAAEPVLTPVAESTIEEPPLAEAPAPAPLPVEPLAASPEVPQAPEVPAPHPTLAAASAAPEAPPADASSPVQPPVLVPDPSPEPAAGQLSLADVLELDTISGMNSLKVEETATIAPEPVPAGAAGAMPEAPAEPLSPAAALSPTNLPPTTDHLWAYLGVPPLPEDQFELRLTMSEGQLELLNYMVKELHSATEALLRSGEQLMSGEIAAAVAELTQLASSIEKTATFFGHDTLVQTSQLVGAIAAELAPAPESARPVLAEVLRVLAEIWLRCAEALSRGIEQRWPLGSMIDRLAAAIAPAPAGEAAINAPDPGAPPLSTDPAPDTPLEMSPEQMQALLDSEQSATWGTTPLTLPAEKADLLQFMITDVKQIAETLGMLAPQLADLGARNDLCGELLRLAGELERVTAEFEFQSLKALITLVGDVGLGLHGVADSMIPELAVRLLAIQSLILQHATALEVGMVTTWPLEVFTARIHRLLEGKTLNPTIIGWHKASVDRLTELDLIVQLGEDPPRLDAAEEHSDWTRPAGGAAGRAGSRADSVRVDASVIDGLLATVGELVQDRARLQMTTEKLRRELPGHLTVEELSRTTERLERSMVALQTGIMSTRLQPLARLFDNYPRVMRDVARIADREADLIVEGAATMVDKSILDGVANPLMLLLRFIAATMIERPADRQAAGKLPAGQVRISARHQGSQVVITLADDGAGYDRATGVKWIAASGLMTPEQAAALGDDELASMLYKPEVASSPVSRVSTMLQETVGGSIMVRNQPGVGSRIDLIIPMKAAILAAVLVAVGKSAYSVPLQSIIEITRLEPSMVRTIRGTPTMRLRDDLFPLLDARKLFDDEADGEPAFALVLTTGQSKAALGVDRVISKQDMIIRQIDDARLRRGPFSGTTLTQSGAVSLVLDVQRVLSAGAAQNARHPAN